MANEKKYGAGGRKEFVRTRVPRAESISAAIILLLMLAAGLAIYRKGQNYDPHLYAVRAESLTNTAVAVEGKAGTAPSVPATAPETTGAENNAVNAAPGGGETSGSGEGGAEHSGEPTVQAMPKEPLEISLAGTKPMGDTEFYDSDNLYEKIDGRAPAYQSFNVQQLRCRSFGVNASAGSYVDVYEYRFDNPVDAFGMFAQERDPKGRPLNFVADGYSGDMGYFYRQGAVYVQIIASDMKPATLAIAKSIADIRAKKLPVDDRGLSGRRKLPAAGMLADSVSFVPENAQGQADFKDVFQAKYNFDGAELPYFIMVAEPGDAAKAWQSFHDFCARFGKVEALPEVNGGKIFSALVFGKWKIVYLREGELGGVFDASDAGKARAFVEMYLRGELK